MNPLANRLAVSLTVYSTQISTKLYMRSRQLYFWIPDNNLDQNITWVEEIQITGHYITMINQGQRHTGSSYMCTTQSWDMDLFTSDAMSSNPDFCLIFSSRIRAHISGSSCSRGSCPVHLDIRQCNTPALLPPYRLNSVHVLWDPSHTSLKKHSYANTHNLPIKKYYSHTTWQDILAQLVLMLPFSLSVSYTALWYIYDTPFLHNILAIKHETNVVSPSTLTSFILYQYYEKN